MGLGRDSYGFLEKRFYFMGVGFVWFFVGSNRVGMEGLGRWFRIFVVLGS